jgi:hypothetical protein
MESTRVRRQRRRHPPDARGEHRRALPRGPRTSRWILWEEGRAHLTGSRHGSILPRQILWACFYRPGFPALVRVRSLPRLTRSLPPASVVARHATRSTPFPRVPLARRGLEIILTRSGGADPVGRGLEIVLAQIGLGRLVFYHGPRSGCPESMRLALDILEGQNFARKNHHRLRRCSGACLRRRVRRSLSICPPWRAFGGVLCHLIVCLPW